MSYPARWTLSAASWAGASRGVSGAEAAWSGGLPLGPCLDAAMRERRDDGAGGLPGGRSGFRSCRLGRSPMPAAFSPSGESGRQGTGRLRSRCSPRVRGCVAVSPPWAPRRAVTGASCSDTCLPPHSPGRSWTGGHCLQAAAPGDPGPARRAPSLPTCTLCSHSQTPRAGCPASRTHQSLVQHGAPAGCCRPMEEPPPGGLPWKKQSPPWKGKGVGVR